MTVAAGPVVRLTERDAPVDPLRLVEGFRPPPRFAGTTFGSYRPNPAFPSQAAARERVERFAREGGERGGLLGLLRRKPDGPGGLYLDGGFGVGKTHLLAAAWHASSGERAFLSFQELVFAIGALGMAGAVQAFRRFRLVCVDEFELDDPGNTHIVSTFLGQLMPAGARVVATSNTLPEQLGEGRFNAEDFRREIVGIASRFESLRVDGPDYRHREGRASPAPLSDAELRAAFEREPGWRALEDFEALNAHLARLHPIRFAGLLEGVNALFVRGLRPIRSQDVALRFVHLVDKVYDRELRLRASGCSIRDLFPGDYRHGGYAKKYSRCLSRLTELLWAP